MSSRQNKIEARKRGALLREVSTSQLVLGSPKTPKISRDDHSDELLQSTSRKSTPGQLRTPRSLQMLLSAFHDDLMMSGSPRSARRKTASGHSVVNNNSNDISHKGPKVGTSTTTPKKSIQTRNISPIDLTPPDLNLFRRSSPKLSKTVSQFKEALKKQDFSKLRKSNTTLKNSVGKLGASLLKPSRLSIVEREEPDISDSDSDYKDIEEPIPPTPKDHHLHNNSMRKGRISKPGKQKQKKTKAKQMEPKLIEINLERLSYTPKDEGKSRNISSLDVLSQILNEYLSLSQPTKSSFLDKRLLRNYSRLISDHFTKLIDHTLNNENLTRELAKSNKQKESLRDKIYEVRKKHDELLVNLEKLRRSYRLQKQKYESNLTLHNTFEKLKGNEVIEENVLVGQDNLKFDKVSLQLMELNKTINPEAGILNKFQKLNDKLIELDETVGH